MKVDVHIHTYISDGAMSVQEVIEKAKEANVKILAITDHNRLDTWDEFKQLALKNELIPIRGVEINAKHKGEIFHLLAYDFEENEPLFKLIKQADNEMRRRNRDLMQKLFEIRKDISKEDYEGYTYDLKRGGWKAINYLMDRGITKKLSEGFKYYRDYGFNFPEYDFPQLSALCEAIKKAGGYSVLAHPMEYYKDLDERQLLDRLEDLKEAGLMGIECYYPTHSQMMTDTCVTFCKQNGMFITSGCDDHGEFGKETKPLGQTIGCIGVEIGQLNLAGF